MGTHTEIPLQLQTHSTLELPPPAKCFAFCHSWLPSDKTPLKPPLGTSRQWKKNSGLEKNLGEKRNILDLLGSRSRKHMPAALGQLHPRQHNHALPQVFVCFFPLRPPRSPYPSEHSASSNCPGTGALRTAAWHNMAGGTRSHQQPATAAGLARGPPATAAAEGQKRARASAAAGCAGRGGLLTAKWRREAVR